MERAQANQNSSKNGKFKLSLRWHLVLLVIGALLPIVFFSVIVVNRLSNQERAASERRILLSTQALADALKRETEHTVRTLQALTASQYLERDDFKSFYNEAQRVTATQPEWLYVILLTPDGRQIINTGHPFGAELPKANEPGSLKKVVETGQPVFGDLAYGQLRKNLAFPVRVPFVRDGKLLYILTAVLKPAALNNLVTSPSAVEGEWTRSVIDGNGVIAARSRSPEKFTGAPIPESFRRQMQTAPEGVYRDTSLDGAKVFVAYTRVADSRWTVAIAVPIQVLDAPVQQAMWTVILTGLALLFISMTVSLFFAGWISRAIRSAASASEALSKGEALPAGEYSISEVSSLFSALHHSSDLLAKRERERDENLERAEIARREAETANRLKDDFLSTVSHELRTPLNAIIGWVSLLRTGTLDEKTRARAAETIERNAKSQALLIDDLLDISRIITGKLHLEMAPVDFAALVASAIDSIRHTAEIKQIELEVKLAKNLDCIQADSNRLQQIVWNLLTNAIKFTPQGGRVAVELKQIENNLEFSVRDDGIGIKPDFLPHVFDRFRQADGSTKRKYGGLGLGLAIVRQLAELHGGSVEAGSEGEGKGATFIVKLPAAAKSENSSVKHEERANSSENGSNGNKLNGLTGVRVLVVDDELDAREMISLALTQRGAEVRSCSSANEAFKNVTEWHPNIILSDIGMPQEDGYDFIQKVRSWEAQAGFKIPAAALTAFARSEDKNKAISNGYQIHISKPIESESLADIVINLLASKS